MTSPPVGSPTSREQALAALAVELIPAKSLQLLDTATARVVTTISVVATLLTGLGLITAGLTNLTKPAQALAISSIALAFLAVLLALTAQVLTITTASIPPSCCIRSNPHARHVDEPTRHVQKA